MKRRGRLIVAGGLLAAALVAGIILRPRPPEKFPLAEAVPANALFYAGFPDYREIATLPTPWTAEILKRLEAVRPHLAGGVAVYIDRSFQWVALARLTRSSTLLAGAEVENGAAVVAQTPEALARHKAREGSLAELPEFKALGSRFFFNVERLKWRGRFRDFSALGFDLKPGPPIVLRGRALYRGGLFRTYLEQYVHSPRHGAAGGSAPAQAALTENFQRVWDEVLHELDTFDTEKVERESHVLSRDFLEGRSFRDFLGRLGPGCGVSMVPTPHGRPALVVWIDLPEEGTRDLAAKMTHRAIGDAVKLRRDRGLAPAFEVVADGPVWRVKWADAKALRLGEAYSPAYVFEKNRFIFSTCASTLTAPAVAPGESHGVVAVEVAPLLDALRSIAPILADDEFRTEAERKATVLYLKTFTGGMMTALKNQFPDPSDLAKYLDGQKAQFAARALEELSKTPAYERELARVKSKIELWAERVGWLERAAFQGRFTSEGLDFELRAWPDAKVSASQK